MACIHFPWFIKYPVRFYNFITTNSKPKPKSRSRQLEINTYMPLRKIN